ncbi:TIR domain-containing protein [Bacillus cereus group sp. BfR-BA-01319]|uniref:TIR domain-containing protein n=1 Tax=Bacillus cereus group sp. BfR-BA-01319 TaxID=2920296 RepID=UPI001F562E23|nr:nucleotide-binding protein [Bacillus cereus group sp. BfR-BA-01319]
MENINTTVFQLKKVMKDIKNYNKEWRYIDAFQRFVKILNDCAIKLGLPEFQFESFHLSNTGKTINDIGYDSLANHINLLEEMLPNLIEDKTEKRTKNATQKNPSEDNKNRVFIVHGRDRTALLETEGILNRAGLEPIVLNRMANGGLTLIEKFEKYADVKYAIVLLTPDDIGALNENAPLESLNFKFRARQNVVFELGFFIGNLGRLNVCCLHKSTVELPTDIHGLAYLPYNNSVEEVEYSLLKELKEAEIQLRTF